MHLYRATHAGISGLAEWPAYAVPVRMRVDNGTDRLDLHVDSESNGSNLQQAHRARQGPHLIIPSAALPAHTSVPPAEVCQRPEVGIAAPPIPGQQPAHAALGVLRHARRQLRGQRGQRGTVLRHLLDGDVKALSLSLVLPRLRGCIWLGEGGLQPQCLVVGRLYSWACQVKLATGACSSSRTIPELAKAAPDSPQCGTSGTHGAPR